MDSVAHRRARLALGVLLGLLAVAELAGRIPARSTVRAGMAAAPVNHAGVSWSAALLMCACCLLATVPAGLLRPVTAAAAVWVAAGLSLVLFGLVTVAGAAALLVAAYRLTRAGYRLLAVIMAAPYLVAALIAASTETRVLAVLLASAIPVTVVAAMMHQMREDSQTRTAARQLTEGMLADHLARGERARIARELHDVVAHHISMIAVQAETARLTTPGLPEAGAQRFAAIGDTARAGLTEMRRLLGVLRPDAQAAAGPPEDPYQDGLQPDRHPQPGLRQLGDLVDHARQASGSAVRLIVSGPVRRLDPGVELAAYRIVQEALTNARRHAPGAAVDVELCYTAGWLRLRIRDNGPGPEPAGGPAGPLAEGHGLLGMRERAAAAGGLLRTGAAGGGFCVEAELPAPSPATATEVPAAPQRAVARG